MLQYLIFKYPYEVYSMLTINDFLKLYPQIMEILIKQGFHNAVIFKGFSTKEEHNLNLLVSDQFTEDTELKPQTTRKLSVKDELTALLKCKIVLTTPDQMESFYLEKLDSTNSVKLTENIPLQNIDAVFGQEWTFNPPDRVSFWALPSTKVEEENVIQGQPNEVLLKELTNYIEAKARQSSRPINLDEVFEELKQAVLPSVRAVVSN